MSNKLVTIASFNTPFEAHIAKGRLESEGIEGFLKNEYLANLYPAPLSGPYGPIELQVREEAVENAKQVLDDI
jgi:hypothetical protein